MGKATGDSATAEKPAETGTALTTPAAAGLPSFMAERAKEDVGKGTSQSAEDNLIPLIYLLQSGSPQAKKMQPEYIKGAEEGDIWLRNSGLDPEIVKGDVGILVQPCHFYKDWVEWLPNRGGYAGRHDEKPVDARETEIPDENGGMKKVWMRENGNTVVETRYHIVRVFLENGDVMQYAIPMNGSQHTTSRGWMARMNAKSIPGVSGPAPSWACLYRLKAKPRSNAKGQNWVVYDVLDAGWVQTPEDYNAGAKLYEAFASGEKKVETPMEETHQGQDAGAAGDDAKM